MGVELNLSQEQVAQAHPVVPLKSEPDTSVREVISQIQNERAGSVLITESGTLKGIFTERDALRLMAAGADLDVPVSDVMTADPVTVTVSDSLAHAIKQMAMGGYRRLPIVDDQGQAVGLLKVAGILHYLVEHFPDVVYTLPPEPGQHAKEREGA